jgi:hypothetical protein
MAPVFVRYPCRVHFAADNLKRLAIKHKSLRTQTKDMLILRKDGRAKEN